MIYTIDEAVNKSELEDPPIIPKKVEDPASGYYKAKTVEISKPNYIQRVRESMKADNAMRQENYQGIADRTKEGVANATNTSDAAKAVGKGVFQSIGQVAGGGANALESLVAELPGAKTVLGKVGQLNSEAANFILNSNLPGMDNPIFNPTRAIANKISDSKTTQKYVTKYEEDPDFRSTVDAFANIVRVVLDAKGAVDVATSVGTGLQKVFGTEVPSTPAPVNTAKDFKPTLTDESTPSTVLNNHVKSAKVILQDAIDEGVPPPPTAKLIADIQKETLAGLAKNVPGYKEAATIIKKIDPVKFSSVDDYARAVDNALNAPAKVAPVTTKPAMTLKESAMNQQAREAAIKGGVSTQIPSVDSITGGFKVKPTAQTNPSVLSDAALAERTAAKAGVLSDIIPTKRGYSSGQITQALELTQGDVKNINLATGNEVGQFMIDNKLVGENIPKTKARVDTFYKDNYLKVREEIGKVKEVFTPTDVPRFTEALTEVQKQIEGVTGLEVDSQKVVELIGKKKVTLEDAQTVKELMDKYFSLYKATGDVKEGTTKLGLTKVRSELRSFIEKKVKDTTGADIRELNNNVSTARSIQEAVENRSTRSITRLNPSLTDITAFIAGSTATGGLGGFAAVVAKRIYESPTFKLKLTRFLNKLSDAEKKDTLASLQKGEVPKNFVYKSSDSAKDSRSRMSKKTSSSKANVFIM